MSKVDITRFDFGSRTLRELAGSEKDGRIARRLLAIAFILEGLDREAAATNCGMSRQTLRDWVHRYNKVSRDGAIEFRKVGLRV